MSFGATSAMAKRAGVGGAGGNIMYVRDRCLSCGGNELLRVPCTPGDHSHIVTGERVLQTVSVVTYVCTDCGHVAQWVNDESELQRLKAARAVPTQDKR